MRKKLLAIITAIAMLAAMVPSMAFAASDTGAKELYGVKVVDGDDGYTELTAAAIGQKLAANIQTSDGVIGTYPVNEDATYMWHIVGSDSVLGTDPVYTVTSDVAGKDIVCKVNVKDYTGIKTSEPVKVDTNKVTDVKVVDGKDGYTPVTAPIVGQKLAANIQTNGDEIGTYPVNEHAAYIWHYEGSDAVLGTDPTYTVTDDNIGKTICVDVTVEGYEGEATWAAKDAVTIFGEFESIKVVNANDGETAVNAPVVGQKLAVNAVTSSGVIGSYPVNDKVKYVWHYEGSDAVLGTEPVFTVTKDNLNKVLCVKVKIEGKEKNWIAKSEVSYNAEVTGVKVVDGADGTTEVVEPMIGQKLAANIQTTAGEIGTYPVNKDAVYTWHYEGSDAVLGTDPVYTVTRDNYGKKICVDVSVDIYDGTATWTAKEAVDAKGTIENVDVVDGDDGTTKVENPIVGQKLAANIQTKTGTIGTYPVNEDAEYVWHYEGSDAVLGTDPVFTVTSDNVGKIICVDVTAKGYVGAASWKAATIVKHVVTGVEVVDGKDGTTPVKAPVEGQKLYANIQTTAGVIGTYPVNEDAEYVWHYEGSDAVLGTDPVYTVTSDNVGKVICVDVTVKDYNGEASWKADEKAVYDIVTGVEVVDGEDGITSVKAPVEGQKLAANIQTAEDTIGTYPVNKDAKYVWHYEGSDAVLGTDPVFTVTSDNVGKIICVDVAVNNYMGKASWKASEKAVYNITVTGVEVVGEDGTTPVKEPVEGQKLAANIQTTAGAIGTYPVNKDAKYVWHYAGSDAVLGTDPVFTVTSDNVGKIICVDVAVNNYMGKADWKADAEVDHAWAEDFAVDKEATCTEDGMKSIHCAECDAVKEETETAIPAFGHNYGEWKVVKEATCAEAGTIERVCETCGEKEIDTIAALNHKWAEDFTVDKEATCTEDGMKSIHCTKCDAVKEETAIPAFGHNYGEWKVVKEATCVEEGSKERTCETCGEKEIDTIATLDHAWAEDFTVDKEATCTEDGIKSIHCAKCDAVKDETAIPALGHDYETTVTKATKAENGSIVVKCTRCGDVESEEVIYSPKKMTLSHTAYTYNGNRKAPIVTITDAAGNVITKDGNYTVKYDPGRVKVGRYAVTVTFKGDYYSGSMIMHFTVGPKNPNTVDAVLYGKDDVKISWSKVTGESWYAVYYKKATSSTYKLYKRTSYHSMKIANLTDGVKYNFKVVPYKKIDGYRCYGTGVVDSVYTLKQIATPTVGKYSSTRVRVNWTNIPGESGYQISKSIYKTGTNIVYTYKTTTAKSKTISAVKGKTYYYKVRAYKTVDGKNIYGPWSYVKAYKLK